jgi:DNA-binding transcriptional regulator YiaG
MVLAMEGSAIYSIGAVARMVGVSVSTLRTWEDR